MSDGILSLINMWNSRQPLERSVGYVLRTRLLQGCDDPLVITPVGAGISRQQLERTAVGRQPSEVILARVVSGVRTAPVPAAALSSVDAHDRTAAVDDPHVGVGHAHRDVHYFGKLP